MKIFILVLLTYPLFAWAHQGENHEKEGADERLEAVSKTILQTNLDEINRMYLNDVKSIFKSKCLDCHGSGNGLPWYSSIPGAKQLIEHDIAEAKEHMDMSGDFPFTGHGTPRDDLEALRKTIEENTMPPFRYKIMHWDSSLTEREKKTIGEWIDMSLDILIKTR